MYISTLHVDIHHLKERIWKMGSAKQYNIVSWLRVFQFDQFELFVCGN